MSLHNAIGSAIYSKLSSGTALTALLPGTSSIYHLQAPEGEAYPYVIYSLSGGGPLNITPSDLRDEVYFIRGYSPDDLTAGSIDAQISNLLHGGSITVSGYTNYFTTREQDLELVESLPNGQLVYMAGAYYRIQLDQ